VATYKEEEEEEERREGERSDRSTHVFVVSIDAS